jgi:acetyl esterase/lipase
VIAVAAIAQTPGPAANQTAATTNATANPVRRSATLPPGVKAERNISYVENGHRNQVLDLFLPEQRSDKPLPLMIWIHGGAWMAGNQANPPVLYLLSKGFAVASVQHRFSSDALWPAQAYDCKAAIRFLRANAAKYNFDSDHFGVGGDSSGAHLAAFVGTTGDVKEMEGDLGNPNVSSRVQAVVDWFGPTDFTLMAQQAGPRIMIQHDAPNSPESRLLGGPVQEKRDAAKTANPLTYIDKNDPPFLIMHGDDDQIVPLGQSVILAKALVDAGVEVTMKTIPGAGHEGPQFRTPESQRLIEEFLSRHLKMEK